MKRKPRYARVTAALSLCAMLAGSVTAQASVFDLEYWSGLPTDTTVKMRELEAGKGQFVTWSLEDKAMAETLGLEEGVAVQLPGFKNVLPGEDAISREAAWEAALGAVKQRYIFTDDMLEESDVYPSFVEVNDTGATYWIFDIRPSRGIAQRGNYRVKVDATSGEVADSQWRIYAFWTYADALVEKGKAEALLEHIDEYDFQSLSVKEKARYSDALKTAGYAPFPDGDFYAVPGNADLPEDEAIAIAMDAVNDKYGLTRALIDERVDTLVSFLINPDGDKRWRIVFQPLPYRETFGAYTVDIGAMDGGVISTSWTYDGEESTAAPDDLNAEFLGVEQLKKLQALEEEQRKLAERMEAEKGPMEAWSLEDKAALSRLWLENGHPKEDMILDGLPDEDDISEEEAIQIAWEAICEKHGTDDALRDKFDVLTTFSLMPYGNDPEWSISFVPKAQAKTYGEYLVQLTSPSATIILCNWYVENFWLHVDALAERGKLDAVNERVELAEFAALPGEEKARIIGLLLAEGYTPESRDLIYAEPDEGAISAAEAMEAGRQAVGETYGLTGEMLSHLFAGSANYAILKETNEAVWLVDFHATRYADKLGTYTAQIPAAGGAALAVEWSLADGGHADTESAAGLPLGEAYPWGRAEIEALEALNAQSNALVSAFGERGGWTDEEKAALAALWAEEGVDPSSGWFEGLPAEGDISAAEAIRIATEAIRMEYAITEDAMAGYDVSARIRVMTPDICEWVVSFIHEDVSVEESYTAHLASDTGEVLATEQSVGAVG